MKNSKKILIILLVSSITYLGVGWDSSFATDGGKEDIPIKWSSVKNKDNLKIDFLQ